MVSGPDTENQMLLDGPAIAPNDGRGSEDSYYNKKITYEEYMDELR